MGSATFESGDWVVYLKQKVSTSPGPRARSTSPAQNGETYNYVVEKYWVVESHTSDGLLNLRTRRGKQHSVRIDDPLLRKASWWERWFFASRFRAVEAALSNA